LFRGLLPFINESQAPRPPQTFAETVLSRLA
jgi:hypothetical protein